MTHRNCFIFIDKNVHDSLWQSSSCKKMDGDKQGSVPDFLPQAWVKEYSTFDNFDNACCVVVGWIGWATMSTLTAHE